ncbi:MAG: hypothetical protein IJW24_00435 [Clostridia bacterium]|nr:hypothetical protein [Clostridia bacterium]
MKANKSLFLSLLVSFICLIVAIVCACVLKFNLVSLILLAGVVVTTIIANILCWRMVAKANKAK